MLGLVGLAFFLTAVAIAFGQDPNLFGDFDRWFRLMSAQRTVFARPPDTLILAAAWFFGTVGLLEFLGAGLRLSLRWAPLRVASRVLSGVGDLVFTALLVLYADRSISGPFLIAVLVGVMAVLLMVYVTLGMYWSMARPTPRPEPSRSRTPP